MSDIITSGYSFFETEDEALFIPMLQRVFPDKIKINTDTNHFTTITGTDATVAGQAKQYIERGRCCFTPSVRGNKVTTKLGF